MAHRDIHYSKMDECATAIALVTELSFQHSECMKIKRPGLKSPGLFVWLHGRGMTVVLCYLLTLTVTVVVWVMPPPFAVMVMV
jgi:hypothetical protein